MMVPNSDSVTDACRVNAMKSTSDMQYRSNDTTIIKYLLSDDNHFSASLCSVGVSMVLEYRISATVFRSMTNNVCITSATQFMCILNITKLQLINPGIFSLQHCDTTHHQHVHAISHVIL